MASQPVAYEGSEPYIFISYAHKDSKEVFEVLSELQKMDYRFWYDDGIAPGSEWPENIAAHLNGAALCMAFITPNSMGSVNCRREINFALSKNIPFLGIVLKETQMPLGMEMQLSAQQNIFKYNYRTYAEFIQKILSCPDIQVTKKESEAVAESSQTEEKPKTTISSPAVSKETPNQTKKNLVPVIAGAAVVVLAVVLAISVLGGGKKDQKVENNSASSTVSAETTGVTEENEVISDSNQDTDGTPSVLRAYVNSEENKLCGNWADGKDLLSVGIDHTYVYYRNSSSILCGIWREENGKLLLQETELFGMEVSDKMTEAAYSMITDDILSITIDNRSITLSRTDLENGGAYAAYTKTPEVTVMDIIGGVWVRQLDDESLPRILSTVDGFSDTAWMSEADDSVLKLKYEDKTTEHTYEKLKGYILSVDGKPYFSSTFDAQDPVGCLYLQSKDSYCWKSSMKFSSNPILEWLFPSVFNLYKDGHCDVISQSGVTYEGTWNVEDDRFDLSVKIGDETKELSWTAFHNGTRFALSNGEETVIYSAGGTVQ